MSESERRLADLPDRVVEGDPHHSIATALSEPRRRPVGRHLDQHAGRWHAFTDRDEFCMILSGHVRVDRRSG